MCISTLFSKRGLGFHFRHWVKRCGMSPGIAGPGALSTQAGRARLAVLCRPRHCAVYSAQLRSPALAPIVCHALSPSSIFFPIKILLEVRLIKSKLLPSKAQMSLNNVTCVPKCRPWISQKNSPSGVYKALVEPQSSVHSLGIYCSLLLTLKKWSLTSSALHRGPQNPCIRTSRVF